MNMSLKYVLAQETPEDPQALRRSSRVSTSSKKVRFEEPLTDREIRIIQRHANIDNYLFGKR